jgi:hypothetical protein
MPIDFAALESELQHQLDERPYVTLAAIAAVGWTLGRRRPWSALIALASVGIRSAIASGLESALRESREASRSGSRMRG